MRPSQINTVRAGVCTFLRLVAAGLLVVGGWRLLDAVIAQALFVANGSQFSVWKRLMNAASLRVGLDAAVVGLCLAAASARLARWAVPVPKSGCPRCGHALLPGTERCPECGLTGLG